MATTTKTRKDKHFLLDQSRLQQAQKILGTRTETETVEIALQRVITEAETDEQTWKAQENFVETAIKENLVIEDVFGHLEKTEDKEI